LNALTVGSATITVSTSDGLYSATCYVYVIDGTPVTDVSLDASASCGVGKTIQLTATIEPSNASNLAVTWATSDSTVATVSQTGLVTGVRVGNAVISITTNDGSFSAYCALTVDTFPFSLNKTSCVIDSVAMSYDGSKIVGHINSCNIIYLCTSSDGGVSWTERRSSGSRDWGGVAISDSGATIASYVNELYIFRSTDSGATWSPCTTAGVRAWSSIKMSADGTIIVVAAKGGYIARSADSGATWSDCIAAGSREWVSIALSSDGTKIFANDSTGSAYYSADSGVSWSPISHPSSVSFTAISRDGTRLFFTDYTSLYCSDNGGATWIQNTFNGGNLLVSSSGSVVASYSSGSCSISSDYGATWTTYTRSSLNTSCGAMSADGSIIKLFGWYTMYTYVRN
jgi:hypothetical protein